MSRRTTRPLAGFVAVAAGETASDGATSVVASPPHVHKLIVFDLAR